MQIFMTIVNTMVDSIFVLHASKRYLITVIERMLGNNIKTETYPTELKSTFTPFPSFFPLTYVPLEELSITKIFMWLSLKNWETGEKKEQNLKNYLGRFFDYSAVFRADSLVRENEPLITILMTPHNNL